MPTETADCGLREHERVVERGLAGQVNWYNHQKGHGRITCDDGRTGLFVHYSGLLTPRRTDGQGNAIELKDGERVRFDIADGDQRGPKCVNVVLE